MEKTAKSKIWDKVLMFLGVLLGVLFVFAMAARAEPISLDTVLVDVTSMEVLAGVVLTGLVVLWGIRKLIRLMNRS